VTWARATCSGCASTTNWCSTRGLAKKFPVHGSERLIRAPATTLFHQVFAYLKAKPDPPRPPSGSMVGREGVAAAALTVRWGSYLAVVLYQDKPLWPEVQSPRTSRISDEEMARINIEASAALAEWIDIYREDPGGRLYEQLVNRAVGLPADAYSPPSGGLLRLNTWRVRKRLLRAIRSDAHPAPPHDSPRSTLAPFSREVS
jgi:hypothetical protein